MVREEVEIEEGGDDINDRDEMLSESEMVGGYDEEPSRPHIPTEVELLQPLQTENFQSNVESQRKSSAALELGNQADDEDSPSL